MQRTASQGRAWCMILWLETGNLTNLLFVTGYSAFYFTILIRVNLFGGL